MPKSCDLIILIWATQKTSFENEFHTNQLLLFYLFYGFSTALKKQKLNSETGKQRSCRK